MSFQIRPLRRRVLALHKHIRRIDGLLDRLPIPHERRGRLWSERARCISELIELYTTIECLEAWGGTKYHGRDARSYDFTASKRGFRPLTAPAELIAPANSMEAT